MPAAAGVTATTAAGAGAGTSPAATPSIPAAGSYSEDEAVLLALKQNPGLRLFRAERAIAEGQIVSATALNNPVLGVDLLHVQAPDKLGVELSLKWTPPQPVEWSARRSQARARLSEVNFQVAEQEWALATQVRVLHGSLLELREQARVYADALVLRRRVATLVRSRMNRGGSTRIEANLVDLALLYAQRDLDEVGLRQVQLQSALAGLLGISHAAPIGVRGSVAADPSTAALDAEALADRAVAARPALSAAHARITQRQQAVRVETARRYPWLGVHGNYRENNLSNYPHDVQLGIDVTVPVLNLNTGPLRVAQAELERERASVEALVMSIRQRVYAACAELNVRKSILQRIAREVLPVLQEHERLMEVAARGAEVDLVALLSSEESVLRGRREHSEARLGYRAALLALEAAVGAPLAGGDR